MLNRRCSGSLYALMGVSETATTEEIRKAYHRMALTFHPDKTGGNTTEQFTRLQEAYSVLSDEQQRKTYNTFGSEGVATLNRLNDMNVPVNPYAFRILCLFLMVLALLLLLQLQLVVVRLDYGLSWYWPLVLIPLWVVLLVPTLCAVILLVCGIRQFDFTCIFVAVELLLFTGVVATFVAGMCGSLSWPIALAPAAVLYVLSSAHVIPELYPSEFVQPPVDGSGEASFSYVRYWSFLLSVLFEKSCGCAFFILAILRALQESGSDTDRLLSFFVVAAPLIACFSVNTLYCLLVCLCGGGTAHRHGNAFHTSASAVCFLFYGGLVYVTCMVAAKANVDINGWVGGFDPSAAVTVIPIQLMLIPLCVLTFVLFITASWVYEALLFGVAEEAERNADNGGAAPSAGVPSPHMGFTDDPVGGEQQLQRQRFDGVV